MDLSAIAIALQVNTPVLLQGLPGVGKTSAIEQLCREVFSWHCETVITSFRDPSDFGGLPVIMQDAWIVWATELLGHLIKIDDPNIPVWMRELAMRVTTIAPVAITERRRGVRMLAPDWVYRLIEAGRGVVTFDEGNWAPPAVQSVMFRIVQEGWVGEERLPDEIRRVVIMNPAGQGGGFDLQAPLANRLVHLSWTNNHRDWIQGMRDGWPTPHVPLLPSTWTSLLPKWIAIVTSFIDRRPDLLHNFPTETAAQGGAWSSNRTWSNFAIPLLTACDAIGTPHAIRVQLLEGSVGQGTATEFFVWERDANLPDIEQLLRHPETFVCPKRPDIAYAVLSAVAAVAISADPLGPMTAFQRWCAAWDIMNRAADAGIMEIAAMGARTLGQKTHWPAEVLKSKKNFPAATEKAIARFQPLMDAALRPGAAA